MYCPVCKAEYRPGFTTCSDCGVELVSELPVNEPAHSYAVLWKGEDAVFHDSLLLELEEAGIAYADTPLHVYARKNEALWPGFGPHFGFVISVHTEDLPEARPILEKLLDVEPDELPYEVPGASPGLTAVPILEMPNNWDLSAATVELYSDKVERKVAFIQDALRELGIPSRRDDCGADGFRLLVRPDDEARATAIRDQIEEQTIPDSDLPEPKPSIWVEEPVRSYALLYYLSFLYFLIAILVFAGTDLAVPRNDLIGLLGAVLALVSGVAQVGSYWMMYQAIRYEIRPLKFFLLAFLPLSFFWYYLERYTKRQGQSRLPIAVRMRLNGPPSS